jgi:hypothetical protein
MIDLEQLGFAVSGFMVAMIGVWVVLRGRDGWYWVAVARDAAGRVCMRGRYAVISGRMLGRT